MNFITIPRTVAFLIYHFRFPPHDVRFICLDLSHRPRPTRPTETQQPKGCCQPQRPDEWRMATVTAVNNTGRKRLRPQRVTARTTLSRAQHHRRHTTTRRLEGVTINTAIAGDISRPRYHRPRRRRHCNGWRSSQDRAVHDGRGM